jgi:aspartyl-tRNA synthetase
MSDSEIQAGVEGVNLEDGEKKLSKKELNKLAKQQKKAEKKHQVWLKIEARGWG